MITCISTVKLSDWDIVGFSPSANVKVDANQTAKRSVPMSLKIVDCPPKNVAEYSPDGELIDKLSESHLNTIVELFHTPLTGSYNWDYESADG